MTLHVCEHPIVEHKLTRLRDEDRPPALFRHLTSEITQVLIVEATADLETITEIRRTPLADFDELGALLDARREVADGRRHRGREERGLPRLGGAPQDALNVVGEADVQHLVSLVQYYESKPSQLYRSSFHMGQQPTRSSHDYVGSPF